MHPENTKQNKTDARQAQVMVRIGLSERDARTLTAEQQQEFAALKQQVDVGRIVHIVAGTLVNLPQRDEHPVTQETQDFSHSEEQDGTEN